MKLVLTLLISVFSLLDLDRPGLEAVRASYEKGDTAAAKTELLQYFRTRAVGYPGIDLDNLTITAEEQKWADEALEHRFFVHQGYQPSFFYGDDIDWTYWPVKDNELRWQLHRHKWFTPLGKAWRVSGDRRYSDEWVAEYKDWIEKNPLCDDENAKFAWRALEVSHRVEDQIKQFLLELNAPAFDEDFLQLFLWNYHRQADYLQDHYSEQGNHLLFEAERILAASLFFPEFKDAASWRDGAIKVLSREIAVQVYPDGVQYELDPHYHLEAAILFYNALSLCDYYGMLDVFPQSYIDTVHKMTQVTYNLLYPDFTLPVFSDCRFIPKEHITSNCAAWSKVFKDDPYLVYLATDGAEGSVPDYLSKAFPVGGFYVLRDGWDMNSTVVDIKAGPKAFWHCQPDNGTFDYWSAGRNFFPDSGSYVYGGDASILKERDWFRQTRVHNTVTLDDRNLETTDSKLVKWSDKGSVTVSNEGYEGFRHTRTFKLGRHGKLTITDVIEGPATGEVGVHFNLAPGEIATSSSEHACEARTLFEDGNNISIRTSCRSHKLGLRMDEGWTSPSYRQKMERPAYTVTLERTSAKKTVLVTVIEKI